MVATSGATLADDATIAAFGKLMDVATLATPNLPELRRLTSEEDAVAGALQLVSKHRCAVLIKGGHEEGDALADALIEDDNMTSWQGQRIDTTSTHGTGCTLASAIAFYLGRGLALAEAVERARAVRAHGAARGAGAGAGARAARAAATCGSTSALGLRLNQVTVTGKDYDTIGRFLPRARPQADRRQPARMAMRGSRPRAARPSRSRSIPRRRSARRPPSISNATTSTRGSSGWRGRASRSSMARATSRGCGARRGCAIPTGNIDLPLQGRRSAALPAVADGRSDPQKSR